MAFGGKSVRNILLDIRSLCHIGLIYLITMSGLVEEVHSSLKKTIELLEQEIHVEEDYKRILKLSHLIRDIDRLQPLRACGLFRKGSCHCLTSLCLFH